MSTAVEEFTNKELEELLDKSKINNSKLNITGLLVVKGRTFLQCLEGPKENVEEIFKKIQKDQRHKDIIELIEENASNRIFPNWDMGFKNIKNLTNIESEKLKNFDLEDLSSFQKEDISQLLRNFIEEY
jgi:RecJ-like exonuclease